VLSDNVGLTFHSRLEASEVFEVGWFPQDIADDDKDKAQDIYCLEVRIDGLEDDDELDEQAIQILTRIAWRLSDGVLGRAYLVLVEPRSLPRSRIRTYKGLFPYKGQIKQGEYIEFEFELEAHPGWFFFVGMAPITKNNRDECFALTRDFTRAFVLISSEQTTSVYTRDFLESIISCLSARRMSISIEYMKLIPMICSQGLAVFSFRSDSRGDYRNISLFFNREIKSLVQQATEDAVNEAAWPDPVWPDTVY
jgi:hypothetical protein